MHKFHWIQYDIYKPIVVSLQDIIIRITFSAFRFSLLLTLLLLEMHVTMMHHSTSQLVDAHLLLSIEAQDVNSSLHCT